MNLNSAMINHNIWVVLQLPSAYLSLTRYLTGNGGRDMRICSGRIQQTGAEIWVRNTQLINGYHIGILRYKVINQSRMDNCIYAIPDYLGT